jgi:uncharacterized FlgJ-related protein
MKTHLSKEDIYCIEKKLCFLINLGEEIMSKISDFADKQNEFNNQMDASVADINADVKALQDQIVQLQNSAGQITPEDQALLDGLQARTDVMAQKLAALDALTPPVPPVA